MMLLGASVIDASPLSLDFFKDKPKSLAKDFYISKFLDQGCSDAEAQILLPQVKNLNPKLFKKFAKHIDSLKRKAYCKKLQKEQFLGKSQDCVQMGLSLYKATNTPTDTLQKIAKSIAPENPTLATQYFAISTKKFDNLLKLPPKLLVTTFNNVGGAFRKKYYNHPLPASLIPSLTQAPKFSIMIEKIVRGKFEALQKSIVQIPSQDLDAESNFLLALNAIRYGQLAQALNYLKISEAKAPFSFEKDKALFWQYLLTYDESMLRTLTQSEEINLYSLYAFEKLGTYPSNIISTIPVTTNKDLIDIKDPFAWIALKKRIKQMKFKDYQSKKSWVMQYSSPNMQPYISRLLYRFKNHTHDYLTPYAHYLKGSSAKRQTLIYALARQESHFVPTEVSYSYALGMMQFMPFVAKDIAKKQKIKNFQDEMMFDPKIAYHFANIHLDFLERRFSHPLFIAYAYNAGAGFTKRKIINKGYFKKGAYEPFWSMEMMPNSQARKYGKRVLANYAIYAKKLGVPVTLNTLLETIN